MCGDGDGDGDDNSEDGGSESSEDHVEDYDYVDGGKDEDDDGGVCDDGGGYTDMNVSTHWTLWEHVHRGCYILPKNLDRTSLPNR